MVDIRAAFDVARRAAFGGTVSVRTGTFYRLNRSGTQPIAAVGDITEPTAAERPNKVQLDMVDSESESNTFNVTQEALQDFTDATSNVSRTPQVITLSGTLTSVTPLDSLNLITQALDFTTPAVVELIQDPDRRDLVIYAALLALANRREPIMYVSPRVSMPRAFIASLDRDWNPETGDNTMVSVSLVEARIVQPLIAQETLLDVAAMNTGNNTIEEDGRQSGTPVTTTVVTQPTIVGGVPTFAGSVGVPFV